VEPGEDLEVTGNGWKPDSSVDLTLNSDPVDLGSAEVDETGSFSKTVTIPADTPPGLHTITVTGVDPEGATRTTAVEVTVVSATPTGAAGTTTTFSTAADPGAAAGGSTNLPRTGGSTSPITWLALGLVLGGTALASAARRRRA
jgi:LPXTG-motif cell wall-anchored protein